MGNEVGTGVTNLLSRSRRSFYLELLVKKLFGLQSVIPKGSSFGDRMVKPHFFLLSVPLWKETHVCCSQILTI